MLLKYLKKSDRLLSITKKTNLNRADLLASLKELLEVQSSNMPDLALEICLQKLALTIIDTSQYNIQPINNISEDTKPLKVAEQKAKPIIEETKRAEETQVIEDQKPLIEAEVIVQPETELVKSDEYIDNLWSKVLDILKTKNSTLYGIARMAEVKQNKDSLELTFKFKFHHKQMVEPKNQKIFSEILNQLTKSPIELKIHTPEENKKIKSEQTTGDLSAISNIFGSTEVLES